MFFLSPNQGLVRMKAFLKSQKQCAQWTVYSSSNFNRKDDSCDSSLAIYIQLFIYGGGQLSRSAVHSDIYKLTHSIIPESVWFTWTKPNYN